MQTNWFGDELNAVIRTVSLWEFPVRLQLLCGCSFMAAHTHTHKQSSADGIPTLNHLISFGPLVLAPFRLLLFVWLEVTCITDQIYQCLQN